MQTGYSDRQYKKTRTVLIAALAVIVALAIAGVVYVVVRSGAAGGAAKKPGQPVSSSSGSSDEEPEKAEAVSTPSAPPVAESETSEYLAQRLYECYRQTVEGFVEELRERYKNYPDEVEEYIDSSKYFLADMNADDIPELVVWNCWGPDIASQYAKHYTFDGTDARFLEEVDMSHAVYYILHLPSIDRLITVTGYREESTVYAFSEHLNPEDNYSFSGEHLDEDEIKQPMCWNIRDPYGLEPLKNVVFPVREAPDPDKTYYVPSQMILKSSEMEDVEKCFLWSDAQVIVKNGNIDAVSGETEAAEGDTLISFDEIGALTSGEKVWIDRDGVKYKDTFTFINKYGFLRYLSQDRENLSDRTVENVCEHYFNRIGLMDGYDVIEDIYYSGDFAKLTWQESEWIYVWTYLYEDGRCIGADFGELGSACTERIRYSFDADRLVSVKYVDDYSDENNWSLDISYDENGNIVRIVGGEYDVDVTIDYTPGTYAQYRAFRAIKNCSTDVYTPNERIGGYYDNLFY